MERSSEFQIQNTGHKQQGSSDLDLILQTRWRETVLALLEFSERF